MSQTVLIKLNGREYTVELNGSSAIVNGQAIGLDVSEWNSRGKLAFRSGARHFRAAVDLAGAEGEESCVLFNGRELKLEYETERDRILRRFASLRTSSHAHADIRASMPGLVVRVNCQAGSVIEKGQALLILEAMKMENEIRSPVSGTVKELKVSPGQAVEKSDLLVVLE